MAIPITMATGRALYETPTPGHSPFDDVPEEIVVKIAGFLTPQKRLTLRLVSKTMNAWICTPQFTNIKLKGHAEFFIPYVQLATIDDNDKDEKNPPVQLVRPDGHRADIRPPKWRVRVNRTDAALPWSLSQALGITPRLYDDGIKYDTRYSIQATDIDLQTLDHFVAAPANHVHRRVRNTAEVPERYKDSSVRPVVGHSYKPVPPGEHFQAFLTRPCAVSGCSDNDLSKNLNNTPLKLVAPNRGLNWKFPDDISHRLGNIGAPSDDPVRSKMVFRSAVEGFGVRRELDTSEGALFSVPGDNTGQCYAINGDAYLASVLLGGEILHVGALTLVNGKFCTSSATIHGIWVYAGKLEINTCLLNWTLGRAERNELGADEARRFAVLNRALATVLNAEEPQLAEPEFDYSLEHYSLQDALKAPNTSDIPWPPALSLYDYQKETIRSMAQLEKRVAECKPLIFPATSVRAFPGTAGLVYVDNTSNCLVSSALGYALKSGTTDTPRPDTLFLYTSGGVLMDDVGMGKTRQLAGLAALSPILPAHQLSAIRGSSKVMTVERPLKVENTYKEWQWDDTMPRASVLAYEKMYAYLPLEDSLVAPVKASVTRILSAATLVVCGNHLLEQWEVEATRAFPERPGIKQKRVITIGSKRDHEATSLGALMAADMVIVTIQFLCGEYYTGKFQYHSSNADARSTPDMTGICLKTLMWSRLVVDEASTLTWGMPPRKIKNIRLADGLVTIDAYTRWLLTATVAPDELATVHVDAFSNVLPPEKAPSATRPATSLVRNFFAYENPKTEHLYHSRCTMDTEKFAGRVMNTFLRARFRFPIKDDPTRAAIWQPCKSNTSNPYASLGFHAAKKACILRQTKSSTIREHYVSKPLHHALVVPLSPMEHRFIAIVSAIPSTFNDEEYSIGRVSAVEENNYKHRVQTILYTGDRESFAGLALKHLPSNRPIDTNSRAAISIGHDSDNVTTIFMTSVLHKPSKSLTGRVLFDIAHTIETSSSKIDTHARRTKMLRLVCEAGDTFVDVIGKWIAFYKKLVTDAPARQTEIWDELTVERALLKIGTKEEDTWQRRDYASFETKARKLVSRFMFHERIRTLTHRLWIEPLEELQRECIEQRNAATRESLGTSTALLRDLTLGTRLGAVVRFMEHMWRRDPSLVMIIASAYAHPLECLGHYLDEKDIGHVNYNKSNYHAKRKALRSIREEESRVRVVMYHIGGNAAAHEGTNLPEVSNIIFIDHMGGSTPNEFEAAKIQTIGRAYRHGQRFQINVIHMGDDANVHFKKLMDRHNTVHLASLE